LRPALLPLASLALAACAASPPAPRPEPDPFLGGPRISVEYPAEGARLGGPPSAFLAGRVAAGMQRGERLDLVLAIDTSGSTCAPVGAPAEAEPECAAPGPGTGPDPGRVVDVEIAAARVLLARLDPALTRVGVVSFGAGAPIRRALHRFQGPDAGFEGTLLELAPTSDFAAVGGVLDALAAREPEGATNVGGALRRATQTLLAVRERAERRLVVFLSDGIPTAPRESERENLAEALRAASYAARSGVRVLSFAIGDAAREPLAALEIAERTGGAFYPVRDAAALPSVFLAVHLDQIARLAVSNATTGAAAIHGRLAADGSWEAVVPLATGANTLELRASTETGEEVVRTLRVDYGPGAESPAIPAPLQARREAARAEELAIVASQVDALERQAAARRRAQLLDEIARERAAARGTADKQRRDLALEIEPPDVSAGP
jgi:hypothetical protein